MLRIVQIKSVLHSTKTETGDADKMEKAKSALLKVLPTDKPGLTQSAMVVVRDQT